MAKQLQFEPSSSTGPGEKGDLLHSVQRALRVLSLVAEHPQGLSAREVSNALQLNISTCYHLLNTLVADGYLDRYPRQLMYVLGPQIPFLNNAFTQSLSAPEAPSAMGAISSPGLIAASLVGRLRSALYRLMEQTQEPSYLACWRFSEIILQAIVEAPQAAKVTKLYVGYRGQSHCHALGKVLLASSDPELVDRYLDMHPLSPFGPNTIVQRSRFIDELNTIVQQGYAIDNQEFASETCCVAAPVFAPQGHVIAALGISFSPDTFVRRADWIIAQVTRAATHARAELRLSFPQQDRS